MVAASSSEMSTNATASAASALRNLSRLGISATHGPHHVAQKFRTTTRPLKSASVTGAPSSVWNVQPRSAMP